MFLFSRQSSQLGSSTVPTSLLGVVVPMTVEFSKPADLCHLGASLCPGQRSVPLLISSSLHTLLRVRSAEGVSLEFTHNLKKPLSQAPLLHRLLETFCFLGTPPFSIIGQESGAFVTRSATRCL